MRPRRIAVVIFGVLFVLAGMGMDGSSAGERGRSAPPWRVVFSRDADGSAGERGLETLSWNDSSARLLVRSSVEDIWSLAWAPDGREAGYQIMIPSWVNSRTERGRRGIYAIALGGATRHLTTAFDEGGAWSPDSESIAFTRVTVIQHGAAEMPTVRAALYIVPNRGGKPRLVARGCSAPASTVGTWSPDGERLVVFCGNELWVMNAEGTARHRLSKREDGALGGPPVWSPDGSLIAYGRQCRTGLGDDYFCKLTVTRPDGHGRRSLPGEFAAGSGSGYDAGSPPVWSSAGALVFPDWSQAGAPLVAVDPRTARVWKIHSRFGVEYGDLTAGSNGTLGFLSDAYLEVLDASGKQLLRRKLPASAGFMRDLWLG
jgi:hypothetical protein